MIDSDKSVLDEAEIETKGDITLLGSAGAESVDSYSLKAGSESVDSYTLKAGAGAMVGFFSSLATLAVEQVVSTVLYELSY